jgi:hypothetical protein
MPLCGESGTTGRVPRRDLLDAGDVSPDMLEGRLRGVEGARREDPGELWTERENRILNPPKNWDEHHLCSRA